MSETPVAARSVADTLRALVGIVANGDFSALADVYADDVVVTHAFGVGEHVRWEGFDELAAHFERAPLDRFSRTVRDLKVWSTDDPEVAVAEYVMEGRVHATGRTFALPNVVVARGRLSDGRLVETRDYHHHGAMSAFFGILPDYVKELEKMAA
ncbi:nuclear transport factor 2 family protein [Streptomyces sp. VRA16 Mangrove soil]|uniref:nuclear transport factor 2 family protein n=1 Tax=Streptomyces sp. VRA16 Mangrove soil TaxID=2817434 RepID=UPI001A9D1A1D|nr:nuclear transport factor 2 family protein [Streptomyces sp. VRA16 Mangrove soil]MBO1337928.1 nuclear transport factor 2 family protein [Streptomyces sp. VRA16 Mangrove soil]